MEDSIFKISKDSERARSLYYVANERISDLKSLKKPYQKIEEYYEIYKELLTAIMYLQGYKTLDHKALIEYARDNYKFLNRNQIFLIDQLRRLRNDIGYYGRKVGDEFLINHETEIKKSIRLLLGILSKLLKKEFSEK